MNWNSRNVLVTGVHGFFGPHIAKSLHEKGAHVIGGYHDKKKYSFCDLSGLSKFLSVVGEYSPRSLDDGLNDTIAWYTRNHKYLPIPS